MAQGAELSIPADTARCIARGHELMHVDPTRWPRDPYDAALREGMRRAVRRWLSKERR